MSGKIMRKKKKAAGNLEIVLSFLIFAGFLFFIFMLFPLNSPQSSSVGLDAAERGIMNFSTYELIYFTVSFNETKVKKDNDLGCFKFEPNISIGNIAVLDENDARIEAGWDNSQRKIIVNGMGAYYQFYSSPEFIGEYQDRGCRDIEEDYFKLGLVRKYPVLSYSRIKLLNETYFSGYDDLKSNFNIPNREDFGFALREINGSIIISSMKSRLAGRNVMSRDVPVQIAYSDGTLKYAILNIQTW